MKTLQSEQEKPVAVRIELRGDVQGVGMRPALARLADLHRLSGSVQNCLTGVQLELHGRPAAIEAFQSAVYGFAPNVAQAVSMTSPLERAEEPGFHILSSDCGEASICSMPLDRKICEACLRECTNPSDRRYGYGLNGCAECGPRYSILAALPYDRGRTSMRQFSMCDLCRREYENPRHRRFHAQNNACPACGPKLWFERSGRVTSGSVEPLRQAATAIQAGQIVAFKGIGGYQLICDATRPAAVARLRQRKGRLAKPLAIMVSSLSAARTLAHINHTEACCLQSSAGPIVVLRARRDSGLPASEIHPQLEQIGLMLPTTAAHHLLLNLVNQPLVVTSGNLEGEPLVFREESAVQELQAVADCFVHHDRPIVRPIDDSLVRCMAGQQVVLRAARGLAPISLELSPSDNHLSAVGGHQKATFAALAGGIAWLSPHVGDLDSLAAQERYASEYESFLQLIHCAPSRIAHDVHPGYASTRFAEQQAVPLAATQHHHAHIAAVLAEQGWLDRQVLGFAFDGTGWGGDGSIWGGEVLLATASAYRRVAHLRPFPLIGGDAAALQPWRPALALLVKTFGLQTCREPPLSEWLSSLRCDWQLDSDRTDLFLNLVNRDSSRPLTSSMGRLFDAIAALVLGIGHNRFEGEAAMRLESCCDSHSPGHYRLACCESTDRDSPLQLDWQPLLQQLVEDLLSDASRAAVSMKFHRGIVECIAELARRFPDVPVVLTGGVFQNCRLVELVTQRLREHTSPVVIPGRIPCNDGGLALGQLVIASHCGNRS